MMAEYINKNRAPVLGQAIRAEHLSLARARLPSGTWTLLLTAASFRT